MNHVTAHQGGGLGARYGTDFTLGEHSARYLRRILRVHLTAWEMAELCDPACLALTELVANVVRHTPDRRATVLMTRRPDGRGVRVEVTDACPRPPLSTAVDELAEERTRRTDRRRRHGPVGVDSTARPTWQDRLVRVRREQRIRGVNSASEFTPKFSYCEFSRARM